MSHTISEIFQLALSHGWKIVNCSCTCGGRYAWMNPDNIMHGCVCHSSLADIESMIPNYIPNFIEEKEITI